MFHVFDRNEIHIQAFAEISPAKLMSGDSSSSTFHDVQEFIIPNDQKIRNSEFRKFKKWAVKVSEISKIIKSQNVGSPVYLTSRGFPNLRFLNFRNSEFLIFC